MTERENALRMINRTGDPGWVPLSWNCIISEGRYPSAMWERPKNGDGEDWFGCRWVLDKPTGGYVQDPRYGWPVTDITKWREQVKFPDYEQYDWAGCAAADCSLHDRENCLVRFMMESGPFERLHSLVGLEEAMISMYTEPEAFKELIEAITDSKLKLIDKLAEYYHPDMLCINDDLGSAGGPLISPEMYREFIKPSHKRLVEAVRGHGIIYIHHSCGHMQAFIDDLIEIGVQVINPIQSMNDREYIARHYADKVSFEICLSTETDKLDVSEEVLRREVREAIDLFGPAKNFILTPTLLATERGGRKMEIIKDEAESYGRSYYK